MAKIVDVIETERLFFRGIIEEDAREIVAWRSDFDVYKYFKNPHKITIEEHLNWYQQNYLHNSNRFDWICIEKVSGQKIGVFGLIRNEVKAEVNYLLTVDAQHKGYAAEGIMRLVQYAADVWNIHQVIAEIHRNNEPSIAVVKKLGFKVKRTDGDYVIYSFEG